MNAHTITQADVRARPFRYSSHITAQDEAWIARNMAVRVKAEQQHLGKRPGAAPGASDTRNRKAPVMSRRKAQELGRKTLTERANQRYAQFARMIGKAVVSRGQAALLLGISEKSAQNAISVMLKRGLVEPAGMDGRATLYRVAR